MVFEDVKHLKAGFDSLNLFFAFAHRLAKWATSSYCDEVWLDGGHIWISDLIVSDSQNIST